MLSAAGRKKRVTAAPLPAKRYSKRLRSTKDDADGDDDIEATIKVTTDVATVSRVAYASNANGDIAQPICATLVSGFRPVWATVRQDLCESQPYYKSYQSGIYNKDKKAYGLYINKFVEPRDVLGRNVLISCLGGSRDQKTGIRSDVEPMALAAMRNSIGQPISVVMGYKHPQFHDLDFGTLIPPQAEFVELGTFRIIDVWKEMVQLKGVAYPVWKSKQHTIRRDLKPWYWVDEGNFTSHFIATDEDCQAIKCKACGKESLKVFENAPWVCLQENCTQFFKVNGKLLNQAGDDGQGLRYSESFLNKAEPCQGKMKDLPQDIPQMFQPLQTITEEDGDSCGTEVKFRRGFTCPICGNCNSQVHWDKRVCSNCQFSQDATPLPYPMDKIQKEAKAVVKKNIKNFKKQVKKEKEKKDKKDDDENKKGVKKNNKNKKNNSKNGKKDNKMDNKKPEDQEEKVFDGTTIEIVDSRVDKIIQKGDNGSQLFIYMMKNAEGELVGTAVLERPDNKLKQAPCGADELLEKIQAEGGAMKFRRNPARCPNSSNEVLTRHFQSNYGVQYEFGVKPIPSVPFKEAPDVVLMSLAHLTDVGKRALECSQLLAREHNYTLVEGSTLMDPYEPYNELLALAYRETDAIGWHDDGEDQVKGVISTASLGSPATMALCIKTAKNDKKTKDQNTVLKVQLFHGDVITMCDTRLQAFTEHKVSIQGVRRYAVTSRAIDIAHYKDKKRADKLGTSVEKMEAAGSLPARASNFSYGSTTLNV